MVSGYKLPDEKPKTPFQSWLQGRYRIQPPTYTLQDMEAAFNAGSSKKELQQILKEWTKTK